MGKKKYKETYKSDIPEKTFNAYIIKSNRQIIKREIRASKRFRIEDNTYIVKDDCIFYKNIEGRLTAVSYYREGNPKPYTFIEINIGLTTEELDRIYAEDFYNIIVDINPENRGVLMFLMCIFNLIIGLLFMVTMLITEYIL